MSSLRKAVLSLLGSVATQGQAAAAEPPQKKEPATKPPAQPELNLLRDSMAGLEQAEMDGAGLVALKRAQPKLVVLDVRSAASFARSHLRGSINAPLTELTEKTLPAVAPDAAADVVLVCDYSFAPTRMISMTHQAYPVLRAAGYRKVHTLTLWRAKGGGMVDPAALALDLPMEGSEVKPLPAAGNKGGRP